MITKEGLVKLLDDLISPVRLSAYQQLLLNLRKDIINLSPE